MFRRKFVPLLIGLVFSVNAFATSGDLCVEAYFKEIFTDKKSQEAFEEVKSAIETGRALGSVLPPFGWIATAGALFSVKKDVTFNLFRTTIQSHKYGETYNLIHLAQQISKLLDSAQGNPEKISQAKSALLEDEAFEKLVKDLGRGTEEDIAQALIADYKSGSVFCNGGTDVQGKPVFQSYPDFVSLFSRKVVSQSVRN